MSTDYDYYRSRGLGIPIGSGLVVSASGVQGGNYARTVSQEDFSSFFNGLKSDRDAGQTWNEEAEGGVMSSLSLSNLWGQVVQDGEVVANIYKGGWVVASDKVDLGDVETPQGRAELIQQQLGGELVMADGSQDLRMADWFLDPSLIYQKGDTRAAEDFDPTLWGQAFKEHHGYVYQTPTADSERFGFLRPLDPGEMPPIDFTPPVPRRDSKWAQSLKEPRGEDVSSTSSEPSQAKTKTGNNETEAATAAAEDALSGETLSRQATQQYAGSSMASVEDTLLDMLEKR